MKHLHYVFCVMMLCSVFYTKAQDTLHITLPQAEEIFINKNLNLLAEKYNIDIAKAQTIQAKLYNNPNFSFSGASYSPERKRIIDIGDKGGDYSVGIQQLITLAGKRNKQIKIAQTGELIAENQFYDLLRTLKFTLRSDFFKAYFLKNSIDAYNAQIESVNKLNNSFEVLEQKGTVTLKDAVRIKSLLYSLRAEQTLLQNQLNEVEAELQQLLQNNQQVFIPKLETSVASIISSENYQILSLIDTAYNNRADLLLAKNNVLLSQQNFNYQKTLAVPDLTTGLQYERRGSYVDKSLSFSVAIDIPFFNKNQGNIKAAKYTVEQSKVVVDKQKLQIENEVKSAYAKVINTSTMLKSIDTNFKNQYEQLLTGVTQNFEKRNISLLDFTDFYDSYKQNILQMNEVQNEYMQALENLNFTCGKQVTHQ